MDTLRALFPTAEELLAMKPEDLAPVLLKLARGHRQGPDKMFWPDAIVQDSTTKLITGEPDAYPFHKKAAVEALVNEAWDFVRRDGLIAPAPGMNGRNGFMVFTRAGEEASASKGAFERVRAAKSFPKTLLHPAIADSVWSALMREDLDAATIDRRADVRAAGGDIFYAAVIRRVEGDAVDTDV
jgi:hypothetical protein